MAWFFGQSLLFVALAFLLGLLVGWLTWGRRSVPVAGSDAVSRTATAPSRAAAAVEPTPVAGPAAEPEPTAETQPEPVAAQAEPVTATAPVPVAAPADNFQRLEGIGPKISGILVAAGIRTYGQLAECDQDTLNRTLRQGGVRIAPSVSTWTTQAKLLAEGDEAGFSALTSQLVAGRRGR